MRACFYPARNCNKFAKNPFFFFSLLFCCTEPMQTPRGHRGRMKATATGRAGKRKERTLEKKKKNGPRLRKRLGRGLGILDPLGGANWGSWPKSHPPRAPEPRTCASG